MPDPSLGIAPGSAAERDHVKNRILAYTKNLAFLHTEQVSPSTSVKLV